MNCRSCGGSTGEPFLKLLPQPPANAFLIDEDLGKEVDWPLELVFCTHCTLVQLSESSFIPRKHLFDTYTYASSVGQSLRRHFELLADEVKYLANGGYVIDVGSNDGVLLRPLKALGVRAVGIEPALNLVEMANREGLITLKGYLTPAMAAKIAKPDHWWGVKGKASVIVASNVFAHVESIDEFLDAVKLLLKEGGTLIIEFQYLADTIKELSFDNIYHEHVFYYTLRSIINALQLRRLTVVDAARISTHGGSLRVYARHGERDLREQSDRMSALQYNEDALKLDAFETYRTFASDVDRKLRQFRSAIRNLKRDGKTIVAGYGAPAIVAGYGAPVIVAGYGAPAKSSTLINSAGLDHNSITYIVEDSKIKQGLYTPKSHIPIVGPEMLKKTPPDCLIIFAWNYARDIKKKLLEQGVFCELVVPMGPENNLAKWSK